MYRRRPNFSLRRAVLYIVTIIALVWLAAHGCHVYDPTTGGFYPAEVQ
jgi:hypothetical protein